MISIHLAVSPECALQPRSRSHPPAVVAKVTKTQLLSSTLPTPLPPSLLHHGFAKSGQTCPILKDNICAAARCGNARFQCHHPARQVAAHPAAPRPCGCIAPRLQTCEPSCPRHTPLTPPPPPPRHLNAFAFSPHSPSFMNWDSRVTTF